MTEFINKPLTLLDINPFDAVGKKWMLISAGDKISANTMTASWGGMGVMWGKSTAHIVIRPQRYTKKFIDSKDTFSICFFEEEFRSTLNFCGKVSGYDNKNKIKDTKLTLLFDDEKETPYFKEASTVLICKKLFSSPFTNENFIDKNIINLAYPKNDFHTLYFGEILKYLVKE